MAGIDIVGMQPLLGFAGCGLRGSTRILKRQRYAAGTAYRLAAIGHVLPVACSLKRPVVRLLNSETCRTIYFSISAFADVAGLVPVRQQSGGKPPFKL